jgi:hypothetical protein
MHLKYVALQKKNVTSQGILFVYGKSNGNALLLDTRCYSKYSGLVQSSIQQLW